MSPRIDLVRDVVQALPEEHNGLDQVIWYVGNHQAADLSDAIAARTPRPTTLSALDRLTWVCRQFGTSRVRPVKGDEEFVQFCVPELAPVTTQTFALVICAQLRLYWSTASGAKTTTITTVPH